MSDAASLPSVPQVAASSAGHPHKLSICPNCQTDLSGGENFCPTCGQPNHDVNVTFGHVVEETLEGVFHFDSKVWLTFKELLFYPGKLTVDFLAGRRARFVPPIRLYVFISLVFFFLVNQRAAREERALGNIVQLDLPKESALQANPPGSAARPDSVFEPTSVGEVLAMVRDSLAAETDGKKAKAGISFDGDEAGDLVAADFRNRPLLERIADGDTPFLDSLIRARGGQPGFWKRLSIRQTARLSVRQENLSHQLLKNLPLGMFLLMPLFALLLKVFYRRQRPLYVQHLIFSIHLHCFFFLLLGLLLLLAYLPLRGWHVPPGIPVALAWAYWVLALRRFSGQTYRRTLWKGSLLFSGYLGLLILFAGSILVIGMATF